MCNCSIFSTPGKYPITTETKQADYYDQVFSGLIIAGFHPGDHLHGTDAAYQAMAAAIDVALLKR